MLYRLSSKSIQMNVTEIVINKLLPAVGLTFSKVFLEKLMPH